MREFCGLLQRTRCARTFAGRGVFFLTRMASEKTIGQLSPLRQQNAARPFVSLCVPTNFFEKF